MSLRTILKLAASTSLGLGLWLSPGLVSAAPSPNQKVKSKGGNFGLGLTLIDPTGITGKGFLAPEHALQFGLGWGWWGVYDWGRIHLDYVWHPGVFVNHPEFDFMPYIGFGIGGGWGGAYGYYDRYCDRYGCRGRGRRGGSLFFRVPVAGLTFHWKKVPMDTWIEAAFTPGIGFHGCGNYDGRCRGAFPWFAGDLALGARWYF